MLILLITNSLSVVPKKKRSLRVFFFFLECMNWDYFVCSELLVFELLLLGVILRSFYEPGCSFFSITLVRRFIFLLAVPSTSHPLLCVLRATILLCGAVV